MRNLLIAIVFLLGIVFIFINIAEVEAIVDTLQQGDWRFLVLALGVQGIWLVNVAASWRAVYRAIGLEERLPKLCLILAAANSINVVAPTGGMGGIAVFISEARRRGYSAARVAVAGGLVVLFDYFGFLCILLLGLIVLFRRNNLQATELIASAMFVLAASVLAAMIYLGMRSADALGKALTAMARRVNRLLWPLIHREYLSEKRAYDFAHEAAGGLYLLRQKPKNLILPVLLGLCSKVLLVVILMLVFLAFDVSFSVGTLVGGFSIGYLFLIVSPTPAGIGFVEGALTLGLRSLNVPLGQATVVVLAYRGITLWLPLLFGMGAFRWLSHQPDERPLSEAESESN
jgi:hypothetical protein